MLGPNAFNIIGNYLKLHPLSPSLPPSSFALSSPLHAPSIRPPPPQDQEANTREANGEAHPKSSANIPGLATRFTPDIVEPGHLNTQWDELFTAYARTRVFLADEFLK